MADNDRNNGGTSPADELSPDSEEQRTSSAVIRNEQQILELARHFGSMLRDLDTKVDEMTKDDESSVRTTVKGQFASSFREVYDTLDVVVRWLEESAKTSAKTMKSEETDGKDEVDSQPKKKAFYEKKEFVLKALLHITGFSAHTCFVGLLLLASKLLDLPENAYVAKRENITECLKVVEQQMPEVSALVAEMRTILKEITKEPQFNHRKAMEFEINAGQADAIIKSCKAYLSKADDSIDELIKNANRLTRVSRGLRVLGWGLTCCGLYRFTPDASSVDGLADLLSPASVALAKKILINSKMNYVGLAAACVASGYAWLALCPSNAYEFQDELEKLKERHTLLTLGLQATEQKLENMKENFHRVKNSKIWSTREDSV